MINEANVREALDIYNNNVRNSERWKLADSVLYDFCSTHPKHTDEHEIVTKIWLIGRTYSASVERRKNANEYEGDFYYDSVAPAMLKIGHDLDEKLEVMSSRKESINLSNLPDTLDAHALMVKALKEPTEQNKVSLASKYLHFHQPESFFVYDSNARKAINQLVTYDPDLKKQVCELKKEKSDRNDEYTRFCVMALKLKECLFNVFNEDLKNKQLDALLLSYPEE